MASSWSQPLDIRLRMNLVELRRDLMQESPVGDHSHDRGVAYKGFTPRTGGRVKRGWKLSRNDGISLSADKSAVILRHPHAHAFYVDRGFSPRAVSGKNMGWNSGGETWRKSRRGYTVPGKEYIREAVRKWAGQDIAVEWRGPRDAKAVE